VREDDQRLLAALQRAYDNPEPLENVERRKLFRMNRVWEHYLTTFAYFVSGALAAAPGDATRRRLRAALISLHLRPGLLGDEIANLLGVDEERAAVRRLIHEAFPPGPLVGRPLLEALLDDEKAFREVPEAEIEAARASAEKLDWRQIPGSEIDHAFRTNSVYIWLDGSSFPFYVPAFLCHALRGGWSVEHATLSSFLAYTEDGMRRWWTRKQRRAIAAYLQYVADDDPLDSTIVSHRETIAAWHASANEP
jgi:hypothetical protein